MPETIEWMWQAAGVIAGLALAAVGIEAASVVTIFGITTTALSVATAVVSVALIAGSIGLQMLLARAPRGATLGGPALPSPEAGHQPLRQAIPPRIVGYGRVRLAGSYVLFEADSGVSYDVVALHHGKISAFVGYYLHDDVVEISGAGVVDVMGDGRYGASSITIKTRLGLDTETAYSEITTPLSTIWTSAYRGDGLASLALICEPVAAIDDFPTIYPRGKPEPSVVADCTAIYDPRDETQDIDDPDTWLVSANPVLQIIDFLTNSDRGMGFDWDILIEPTLTDLMVEADNCDAVVAKADGTTEPRYASNGSFPLDADPADVIATILDTCDGWLSENGNGALVLRVGVYSAPELVLQSKHVRGVSIQYDLADEEAVNELTIDYTESQLDYKTVPGEPWRNETDISERGKTLSQRFALSWVYSHPQARRLAKRRDAQNNATLRGTITTTLYGLQALSERWIRVEAPDLPDLSGLVIENRGMAIDLLNAQCTIKFISVNPNEIDAWDPETEEGSPPTIPEKLISPPPPVPQNIDAVMAAGSGGSRTLEVSLDDPGRSDLTYQGRWRVNGSSDPYVEGPSRVAGTLAGGRVTFVASPSALAAGTWEVQARSFAPAGAASAWSSSDTAVFI